MSEWVKVIKEKKLTKNESHEAFDEQNKKFALLDLLLKAKESNELTDEDIQEEVDTFMFEVLSSILLFAEST